MKYRCYASCAFGIEGVLAAELKKMEFQNVAAQDARVYFDADEQGIAYANVFLRTADRVYMVLKEFEALTFDQLFEEIKSIPFADFLPSDARFPVDANAVQSELMSVSDVQSIAKKAVVRSLQRVYKKERFAEDGNVFHLFVNLYKNKVTVALNTSGAGLNRRGYRLKNVQAPLKETLAAALLGIARWHSREFYDPMCGSGTIAIEAAMQAADMAPGIKRRFDAQSYSNAFHSAFKEAREDAKSRVKKPQMRIYGSDIDAKSIRLAKEHAYNMDVGEWIDFSVRDAVWFSQPPNPAAIITNPPYAVRMGEEKQVEKLYKDLGRVFGKLQDTVIFIICSSDGFEKQYGKKADKRRKLYNGNLKCTYYQYFRKER
ncbi:class I SAM-dependent RNA methyltransferase [Christensenellaceae bacterium OttesenSCG-928-K19]|nr:class I SAM-dependent RNA methyltransferase [Christensenellaceae bacterium OttesenSCG-928-K19]